MIDLNKYSDKQIVEAMLQVNGFKLMAVMSSLGKVMERINTRAETISEEVKDEQIDESIRRLFEGKE